MKMSVGASSIVYFACFFLLTACDSVHIPHLLSRDEVPEEVKAQPRVVRTLEPTTAEENWPRLGDVPFKPKNFTPEYVSERQKEELARSRSEAQAEKKAVLENSPAAPNAAMQNKTGGASQRLSPPLYENPEEE